MNTPAHPVIVMGEGLDSEGLPCPALGFEFHGTFIVDPTTDESGRFTVDPATYYGLSEEETRQLLQQ